MTYLEKSQVYEHMAFSQPHVRIASMPGMWERTLTVGSAGKSFSVTGWKLGWTLGCKELIAPVATAHGLAQFCCTTPLQDAVAGGLEEQAQAWESGTTGYFEELNAQLLGKRDMLVDGLRTAGLKPIVPGGAYFMLASAEALLREAEFNADDEAPGVYGEPLLDYKLSRWLLRSRGVVTIPPSVFYSDAYRNEMCSGSAPIIRFCFCKTDGVLLDAISRLQK